MHIQRDITSNAFNDTGVVSALYVVYFDGLCEPCNPGGIVAYGYVIYQDQDALRVKITSDAQIVGEGEEMTNNVAEYSGLLGAACWLNEHVVKIKTAHNRVKITIRGDSQIVINQMGGIWEVKSRTSQHFVPLIRKLLDGYDVTFEWVPREENQEADMFCSMAYKHYCSKQGRDAVFMERRRREGA